MRTLNITTDELEELARKQAAKDHVEDSAVMPPKDCVVNTIEYFDRIYSGTPDDIGEIDVQYSYNGWSAIYGFTADGKLTLYMD